MQVITSPPMVPQTGLGIAPLVIAAIPIIAGGVTKMAEWLAGGCGNTCVEATSIVNQAEQVLAANQEAFAAGQISKAQAVQQFQDVWNYVRQSCASIPGDAGTNCIADRQRGGKWDWFAMHLDPIVNAPDNTAGTSTVDSLSGASYGFPTVLLIGGALILVGVMISK